MFLSLRTVNLNFSLDILRRRESYYFFFNIFKLILKNILFLNFYIKKNKP
jgi:hypothetical protein